MSIDLMIEGAVRRVVREELPGILREQLRAVVGELKAAPAAGAEVSLTVEDVAERCGRVTPETVREWIRTKKLAARRVNRRWLITPKALELFLASVSVVGADEVVTEDQHVEAILGRVRRLGAKR